jgi:hypothetical protein
MASTQASVGRAGGLHVALLIGSSAKNTYEAPNNIPQSKQIGFSMTSVGMIDSSRVSYVYAGFLP